MFEMTKELKDFICQDERYKGFVWPEKPVEFNKFFANQSFDVVQVHTCEPCFDDAGKIIAIVGFCGLFEWKHNILRPLDHDSYSDHPVVYAFSFFEKKEHGIQNGLNILVGDDW